MSENSRTEELQQFCPYCRNSLFLAERIRDINVWRCRNEQCGYEDHSGLTMEGLSFETQQFCRDAHSAFLRKHSLKSWPLKICVNALPRVPARPQQFFLEIQYGSLTGGEVRICEHPEADLKCNLTRELRVRFEACRGTSIDGEMIRMIREAVMTGTLPSVFTPAQVATALNIPRRRAGSFIPRHRLGNPSAYPVFFVRIEPGLYRLSQDGETAESVIPWDVTAAQ